MNIILITADTLKMCNNIELYGDYKIKTDKFKFVYNKYMIDSYDYNIDDITLKAKICDKYIENSAFVIFTAGNPDNYKKYAEACDYWYYIDSNENIQCLKSRKYIDYSHYIHIHEENSNMKSINTNHIRDIHVKVRGTYNIPAWESYEYIMKAYNDSINGIKCNNLSFIKALIRDYPNNEMRYTLETIRSLYEPKPFVL